VVMASSAQTEHLLVPCLERGVADAAAAATTAHLGGGPPAGEQGAAGGSCYGEDSSRGCVLLDGFVADGRVLHTSKQAHMYRKFTVDAATSSE
jgi:hypothetical protein